MATMPAMRSNPLSLIDFHSHILPGADHGSDSLTTSLYQLALAREASIDRVVATPHFYPDRHTVEYFLAKRTRAYETLSPHLNGDLPEISLGAEVLICPGIDHMEGIEQLYISGTNSILIELPFSDFESSYCDVAYALAARGANVILAHADRYPKENIERMLDAGAKIQLNAASLAGMFRKKHLYTWLERDVVVALGSDIHGRDNKAYKKFTTATERIGSCAERIMQHSIDILNLKRC